MSEVRLHCNQSALIRERWGPAGHGLRWDGADTGLVVLVSRLRSSMFVDVQPECGGSRVTWDHLAALLIFPNSARLERVEYDLSVFTGCQRGIYVTVSD